MQMKKNETRQETNHIAPFSSATSRTDQKSHSYLSAFSQFAFHSCGVHSVVQPCHQRVLSFNPLGPNSDPSQTSHCNNKALSVSEVMRIENMITQVKFY